MSLHVRQRVARRPGLINFGQKGGAAEGTRTPDPIITNDVLYQLSYSGLPCVAGQLRPRASR